MSHVVIIGGGIIGSSTAYWLTRSASLGATKVTILEGTEIAAGASGKAGGLLALDWHGSSTASLAELSYSLHRKLAQEHNGESRWGYRQLDTVSVVADLSSSRKSSCKVDQVFSWLNTEALSNTSILGTKDSTAQVHPQLFTRAMAELAQEKGVEVVYGTAKSVDRQGDSFKVKATARDGGDDIELVGSHLVVAAGPWSGQVLKQLGLKGGRARSIDGSRAHSVVLKTAESRPLPAQALFTSIKEAGRGGTHEPEIYNRPDGTAYCCGATDNVPLPPTAADVKVDEREIAAIIRQVGGLAPSYLAINDSPESATIQIKQACYLPVGSAGGDPVIGLLPGESNVYIGSGHSCWGITNGPATGLVLAELILEGRVKSANVSDLRP